MKRKQGNYAPVIRLPAVDGSLVDTSAFEGRSYMISFFRFATCPMCNMRMHELVTRWEELNDDFTILAIFDSPLEHLRQQMEKHKAPFPVVSDDNRIFYDRYGIEHSMMGVVKGVLFRPVTLIKSVTKGYIPTTVKGDLTTMPAEFLVDDKGKIQVAYYGKDEGDHLDFQIIKEFSFNIVRQPESHE